MAEEENPNVKNLDVNVNSDTDIEVAVTIGNLTQADAELWGKLPDGSYTTRIGVIWDNNGTIRVRRSEYPNISKLMLHFTAVNDPNDPSHQMRLGGKLQQSGSDIEGSKHIFRGVFASSVEARTIVWSLQND